MQCSEAASNGKTVCCPLYTQCLARREEDGYVAQRFFNLFVNYSLLVVTGSSVLRISRIRGKECCDPFMLFFKAMSWGTRV